MTTDGQLPTEEQRRRLCELMHHAFVDLRTLGGEQANDLAYAFHNLPVEMYGWGTWSVTRARAGLLHYQQKYASQAGVDYVALLDEIFGSGS